MCGGEILGIVVPGRVNQSSGTISNKTGLQSVSRPVEIVHYSKGWSKSLEYLIRIIFAIFYIAHMLRMVRATLILPVISEVPVELGI